MDLVVVLPFLGKLSPDLSTRSKKVSIKTFPFVKLKLFLNLQLVLPFFFQFKDKMPHCLRSNVAYKFSCGRCNATYYATCRHLSDRVGEHSGVSPITVKK